MSEILFDQRKEQQSDSEGSFKIKLKGNKTTKGTENEKIVYTFFCVSTLQELNLSDF